MDDASYCVSSNFSVNFDSNLLSRVFYNNYPAPGPDQSALVTPSTDGQNIPLPGINDYAGQILKDERAEFDSSGVIKTIRVCTNVQVLENSPLVSNLKPGHS